MKGSLMLDKMPSSIACPRACLSSESGVYGISESFSCPGLFCLDDCVLWLVDTSHFDPQTGTNKLLPFRELYVKRISDQSGQRSIGAGWCGRLCFHCIPHTLAL